MVQSKYIEDGQTVKRVVQEQNKKTVFLIGDSIRMGYCETVQAALRDISNVIYPDDNCRNTQYVLTSLRSWTGLCDPNYVDVVHFNCGHWDVAHWNGEDQSLTSIETYADNIGRIIRQLQQFYPNAKIIFATTTAMNPTGAVGVNPRTNSEIMRYNAAGATAALANGAMVNDLYALTKDWEETRFADYCHFTQEGFSILGKQVAACIKKALFIDYDLS